MSRDWNATFTSWGAPPGTTEQTKCETAERAVHKAHTPIALRGWNGRFAGIDNKHHNGLTPIQSTA